MNSEAVREEACAFVEIDNVFKTVNKYLLNSNSKNKNKNKLINKKIK